MSAEVGATINIAVMAPAGALFRLKFHQVAIYTDDVDREVSRWVRLGYMDWHRDKAVLLGRDRGRPSSKNATMAFNYDILPLELEYVSYDGRRNFDDPRTGRVPFLSHMSTIVTDINASMVEVKRRTGMEPYHQFTTHEHSNPHIKGKKRFREAIYDTSNLFGFDVKMIQRVPWTYKG